VIKVSEIVNKKLSDDNIALEAARLGILNLSAYAKQIKSSVEHETKKEVRLGTLVVALTRCIPLLIAQINPLKPDILIQDISIRASLFEITFEKTTDIIKKVSALSHVWLNKGFFTITEGLGEVTIICDDEFKKDLVRHFNVVPKGEYTNLVGITVRFDQKEYIEVPNAIFSLIYALAIKRVNVIEVVSTYSEISFIVRSVDMDSAIEALKQFLSKAEV
jgi:hypothetical protein